MAANESRLTDSLSAALLTPPGRGAVATISVAGPAATVAAALDCHFAAANRRSLRDQPVGRICFGGWSCAPVGQVSNLSGQEKADRLETCPTERTESEDVVITRPDEVTVEVCCHGGPTAVERILSDLRGHGIPTVSWQEQLAGQTTTLKAELQSALARATTKRTALKLLEQQSILPAEFSRWTDLARGPAEDSKSALEESLTSCLRWARFGLHLTTPWRVVLAGRPNVGKSTLLNALAGFTRAIVCDEPGTTRDVLSVETALAGWPVLIQDTAGLREATEEIEREGVSRTRRALDEADCVCLLLDSGSELTAADWQLVSEVESSPAPSLLIASKSDLACVWDSRPAQTIPVSATGESGIEELIEAIVKRLVPEEPPAQSAVPITSRQVDLLNAAREALRQGDLKATIENLTELNPDDRSRSAAESVGSR